jgi:hypothetical protein
MAPTAFLRGTCAARVMGATLAVGSLAVAARMTRLAALSHRMGIAVDHGIAGLVRDRLWNARRGDRIAQLRQKFL